MSNGSVYANTRSARVDPITRAPAAARLPSPRRVGQAHFLNELADPLVVVGAIIGAKVDHEFIEAALGAAIAELWVHKIDFDARGVLLPDDD